MGERETGGEEDKKKSEGICFHRSEYVRSPKSGISGYNPPDLLLIVFIALETLRTAKFFSTRRSVFNPCWFIPATVLHGLARTRILFYLPFSGSPTWDV